MIRLSFILTLLLDCLLSVAQTNNIHLSFNIKSKDLKEVNIKKMGLVSGLSKNPDLTIPLKIGKGYFNGHLITNGLYQIADGIEGHIVYLEENDSAAIHLSTRNDMKANLAAHIYMKYFHTLTATGKYAWHYMFFDYLTAKTERMIFGIKGDRVVNNDSTSMLFKKDCDYALQIGNRLVDSLYKKDLVSLNFKKVIKEELNAIYVSNLCTYLSSIRKKKINPLYFEKLNSLVFNDSVFAVQCHTYIQAGSLYTYYIHNEFNPYNFYSNLLNELNSIEANYSGIIRDKLLSLQIADYIGKNYALFDTCYQLYLKYCKNETYKYNVVKKINAYSSNLSKAPRINFAQLISETEVLDRKLKPVSLIQLFSDSVITLFDCWASWCVPCKRQMPYIDSIREKYKGRIKIIYLSFDTEKQKWLNQISKYKNTQNQYLLKSNFKSSFSEYFNIQLIPRYILFSNKGFKVLNSNMPLPSIVDDFIEELEKYLE